MELVDVVVADNASADESVEVASRNYGVPVRIVQLGRNAGYAAGINAAVDSIDRSTVDHLLILNPDIRLRPGSVAPLVAALTDRPRRGIVVPLLVNPDGSLQLSLRRAPSVLRALTQSLLGGGRAARLGVLSELVADPRAYRTAGPVVWATGAAMLISIEAADAIGPWDESLLLYSEETDFALRAGDRGYEIWFEPSAVFEHISGDAYRASPPLHALLTVNRVRVYRRHHGALAGLAYHCAVGAGEVLRAVAGRPAGRAAVVALAVPSRRLHSLPD